MCCCGGLGRHHDLTLPKSSVSSPISQSVSPKGGGGGHAPGRHLVGLAGGDLLVAGCGGGGATNGREQRLDRVEHEEEPREEEGKEGEEKPSSEKAALVKAGDEICSTVPQNYAAKLKALEKKNGGKKPSTKETNLKAAVPPLYTAIEEFEELSAPSGEEEKLAAIVAALEAAAKGLEAKPTSELSGPKSPFAEFQKLTGEYGFQVCSQL